MVNDCCLILNTWYSAWITHLPAREAIPFFELAFFWIEPPRVDIPIEFDRKFEGNFTDQGACSWRKPRRHGCATRNLVTFCDSMHWRVEVDNTCARVAWMYVYAALGMAIATSRVKVTWSMNKSRWKDGGAWRTWRITLLLNETFFCVVTGDCVNRASRISPGANCAERARVGGSTLYNESWISR